MSDARAALLAVLLAPAGQPLGPLPATLVVVAHPDDETVGAGSRLPRLAGAGFVCLTDGAPRDGEHAAGLGLTPAEYARARRLELQTVLVRCGIAPGRLQSLDCPDQQARLQLVPLAQRLAQVMEDEATEVVLTQPCDGGHPDHDATAFVAHAAVALLRARGRRAPGIVEMASYLRGRDGRRTASFVPVAADGARMLALTPEEQRFKAELIACFVTQAATLSAFPTDVEGFRPAPRYDFGASPHLGALAGEALAQLGLEAPL